MFEIKSSKIINLTATDVAKRRMKLMQDISKDELISFISKNESYSVTVFTDVDCGYCRKLHDEIENYNDLGISIHYAAFPRSGIGTEAFTKMVGAWCSEAIICNIHYGVNRFLSGRAEPWCAASWDFQRKP